jgi:hypothetical protein
MADSVISPAAIDPVRNVHSPPHTWRVRRRGPPARHGRMECECDSAVRGSGRLDAGLACPRKAVPGKRKTVLAVTSCLGPP